jgi:hypothetical protein
VSTAAFGGIKGGRRLYKAQADKAAKARSLAAAAATAVAGARTPLAVPVSHTQSVTLIAPTARVARRSTASVPNVASRRAPRRTQEEEGEGDAVGDDDDWLDVYDQYGDGYDLLADQYYDDDDEEWSEEDFEPEFGDHESYGLGDGFYDSEGDGEDAYHSYFFDDDDYAGLDEYAEEEYDEDEFDDDNTQSAYFGCVAVPCWLAACSLEMECLGVPSPPPGCLGPLDFLVGLVHMLVSPPPLLFTLAAPSTTCWTRRVLGRRCVCPVSPPWVLPRATSPP